MKKNIHYVLVAFSLLFFANCRTTVKIDNLLTTQSVVNLAQQPLNIDYTSTDLTKEFMISFKNYLANECQKKGIKAQLETTKDKLPTPYQLNLSIVDETKRRIGILFGAVYQFNGATITVELKNTEGVKLNADDRVAIDTISGNAIKSLTPELEKQCKDSADVLRKRLVDSLVIVREQEIMMQAVPNQ